MECVFDEKRGDFICHASPIPWSVRAVTPKPNYTLELSFSDDTNRLFDFTPLLSHEVYSSLAEADKFMAAKAVHGSVIWPGEIDIAPEHLYENSVLL